MSVFWGVFFSFLHLESLFFTFLGEISLLHLNSLAGLTWAKLFSLCLGDFSLFSGGVGLY